MEPEELNQKIEKIRHLRGCHYRAAKRYDLLGWRTKHVELAPIFWAREKEHERAVMALSKVLALLDDGEQGMLSEVRAVMEGRS